MVKKVFKYGTGQEVPEGAVYLTTIVEEGTTEVREKERKFRLVWHYFLIEEEVK